MMNCMLLVSPAAWSSTPDRTQGYSQAVLLHPRERLRLTEAFGFSENQRRLFFVLEKLPSAIPECEVNLSRRVRVKTNIRTRCVSKISAVSPAPPREPAMRAAPTPQAILFPARDKASTRLRRASKRSSLD
jgi:hypothetical protein